jgi:hypothetical protein
MNIWMELIPELRNRGTVRLTSPREVEATSTNQGICFFDDIEELTNAENPVPSYWWWPFAPLLQALLCNGDKSIARWVTMGQHSQKATTQKRRAWIYFLPERLSEITGAYSNQLARAILLLSYPYAFPGRSKGHILGRADLTDLGRFGLLVRFDEAEPSVFSNKKAMEDAKRNGLYEVNWSSLRKHWEEGDDFFNKHLGHARDEIVDAILSKSRCGKDQVGAPNYRFLNAREIAGFTRMNPEEFATHYESHLNSLVSRVNEKSLKQLGLPAEWGEDRIHRIAKYAFWVHDFAPGSFSRVVNIPVWQPSGADQESASIIVVLRPNRWFDELGSRTSAWTGFCEFLAAMTCASGTIAAAAGVSRGVQEAWDAFAHEVSKLVGAFTTDWMITPGEGLFRLTKECDDIGAGCAGELRLSNDFGWLKDDIAIVPFRSLLERTGELLRFWTTTGMERNDASTVVDIVLTSFRLACAAIEPSIVEKFGGLDTPARLEGVRRRRELLAKVRQYQETSLIQGTDISEEVVGLLPARYAASALQRILVALFTNCIQHGDPASDIKVIMNADQDGVLFSIENRKMPADEAAIRACLEIVIGTGHDAEVRDIATALRQVRSKSEGGTGIQKAHTTEVVNLYLDMIQGRLREPLQRDPQDLHWRVEFVCQL